MIWFQIWWLVYYNNPLLWTHVWTLLESGCECSMRCEETKLYWSLRLEVWRCGETKKRPETLSGGEKSNNLKEKKRGTILTITGWWLGHPLKNMSSSIGMIWNSQYEWENAKNWWQPNSNKPYIGMLQTEMDGNQTTNQIKKTLHISFTPTSGLPENPPAQRNSPATVPVKVL